MHRLAGDTQRVTNLLPRPALRAGHLDLVGFDPLGQSMQRQRRAKPNRRVIRREIGAEFVNVHVCQFTLTHVVCQRKLTASSSTESPVAQGFPRRPLRTISGDHPNYEPSRRPRRGRRANHQIETIDITTPRIPSAVLGPLGVGTTMTSSYRRERDSSRRHDELGLLGRFDGQLEGDLVAHDENAVVQHPLETDAKVAPVDFGRRFESGHR